MNDALEALRKVKHEEVTEEFPKADMWCHFGTGIIRGPDEGNLLGDFYFRFSNGKIQIFRTDDFIMSFTVLKNVLLPSIEEANEGEWSIDEATKKLQSPEEGNDWKVIFKEGVDLDEKILEGNSYEKTSEDYIARYDLTYVTPCWHEIRCKVVAYSCFQKGCPTKA